LFGNKLDFSRIFSLDVAYKQEVFCAYLNGKIKITLSFYKFYLKSDIIHNSYRKIKDPIFVYLKH